MVYREIKISNKVSSTQDRSKDKINDSSESPNDQPDNVITVVIWKEIDETVYFLL